MDVDYKKGLKTIYSDVLAKAIADRHPKRVLSTENAAKETTMLRTISAKAGTFKETGESVLTQGLKMRRDPALNYTSVRLPGKTYHVTLTLGQAYRDC